MTLRSEGFTLMEMMIALVVGAIIVSPLYIVTRSMTQQTDLQRMEVEAMQRSRIGMSTVTADFNRAGLMVSPNPSDDPQSVCSRSGASCSLADRYAVAHLNTDGAADFDSVLLSGSFLGSRTLPAIYLDGQFITLPGALDNSDECLVQFDPSYAFVHITGPSGKTWDSRASSVAFDETDARCTIGVNNVPGFAPFTSGDPVYIGANQTVLYRVEPVGTGKSARNDLVRYFVPYTGPNSANFCPPPANIGATSFTRQVVADYVEEFEVWFRTVSRPSGDDPWSPTYYVTANLGSMYELTGDTVDPDQVAPGSKHYFTTTVTNNSAISTHLSCDGAGTITLPAQFVRSAMIRLAVRTDKTDQSIDATGFGTFARIPRLSMILYDDEGRNDDRPGAVYKLKTLVTEVPMPNLAIRPEFLP